MTRLNTAPWLQAAGLVRLFAALDAETRVVGGAVRNTLAGLPPGDVDLATVLLPEEVMRRVAVAGFRAVPTGIAHGTVTAVIDHVPYEITTLREDVVTYGRRAVVQFGTSWEKDALRRDFTFNALSVDAGGKVHDYTGGVADLAAGRVRFIGDAALRVREDYLRILRFFRFFGGYGRGEPDAVALAACAEGRDGLAALSRERVRAECLKILSLDRCVAVLELMLSCGVLSLIIGSRTEIGVLARLMQIDPACDPLLRLGALCVRDGGDVETLVSRLRLSRVEASRLSGMAGGGVFTADMDAASQRRMLFDLGVQRYQDRARLAWACSGDGVDDVRWRAILSLPARWAVPDVPFSGADVIAAGVPAGAQVGRVLARARAMWLEAGCPPERAVWETILRGAVGD